MKVKNMTSARGNKVANQFIIQDAEIFQCKNKGDIFQSYASIIAFHPYIRQTNKPKVYLDGKYWDCSQTTGKYRNIFLCETKAETQKKIDSGEYKLVNLN